MGSPAGLSRDVRDLIETLVASTDAALRARIVVDAVLASGAARAAALWRRPRGPVPDPSACWSSVLERGASDTLPPAAQVRAVLTGALDPHLPGSRRVLGPAGDTFALALGDVSGDEQALDFAHGVLLAWSAVEEAGAGDALDLPSPPFPAPGPAPGLTHDLRNLLAGIRTSLDVLEGAPEALTHGERADFEQTVLRECARASELLVSALGVGAERLSSGAEPCVQVVADAALPEQHRCRELGIELELVLDPTAAGHASTLDSAALARVVRNLLVNAREALESDRDPRDPRRPGHIRLALETCAGPSGGLLLSVEDDGPGVSPALAKVLFTRDASSKSGPWRRGQGLATVRDLVVEAGGEVGWTNGARGGARFEVRLPKPSRPAGRLSGNPDS